MLEITERFVAEWIQDNVKNVRHHEDSEDLVERLSLRLENDAWEFGLNRSKYLDAVNGNSHELVLFEVKRALEQDIRHRA